MKSKLLIISMVLTIVIVCSACGNQKDKIYIEKGSAFDIEQNTLKIYLTLANGTEQTSEPFKVKLKINNPILSAALGFYEKEIIEYQI